MNFLFQDLKFCDTDHCKFLEQDIESKINNKISPCDDFFTYACGKWNEEYEAKKPFGIIKLRDEEIEQEIQQILGLNSYIVVD